jgi:hypothetical protein
MPKSHISRNKWQQALALAELQGGVLSRAQLLGFDIVSTDRAWCRPAWPHHFWGLTPTEDTFRQNEVVLAGERVLRMTLIGLRLEPDRFMQQLVRALTSADSMYSAS